MEFLNNLLINIGNAFEWLFMMLWDYVKFSYTLHIELINQNEKYPYAVAFIFIILFLVGFFSYISLKTYEEEYGYINLYELKIPFLIFMSLLVPFLLPIALIRIFLDKKDVDKEELKSVSTKKDDDILVVEDGFYVKKSTNRRTK